MAEEREQRDDLQQAAAETREPEIAARIRAEDDELTDRRQAETEARLGETQETLARTAADMERSRAELAARDRELRRTREIAQEIHRDAATIEATRIQPDDVPDVTVDPDRRR